MLTTANMYGDRPSGHDRGDDVELTGWAAALTPESAEKPGAGATTAGRGRVVGNQQTSAQTGRGPVLNGG